MQHQRFPTRTSGNLWLHNSTNIYETEHLGFESWCIKRYDPPLNRRHRSSHAPRRHVSLTLTTEVYARLEALADAHATSVHAQLRAIVTEAVSRQSLGD